MLRSLYRDCQVEPLRRRESRVSLRYYSKNISLHRGSYSVISSTGYGNERTVDLSDVK